MAGPRALLADQSLLLKRPHRLISVLRSVASILATFEDFSCFEHVRLHLRKKKKGKP